MTDTVALAALALRRRPPADRDGMARAILALAEGAALRDIEPEHVPAAREGLAQIERGEFVEGDPEVWVEAAFRPHAR